MRRVVQVLDLEGNNVSELSEVHSLGRLCLGPVCNPPPGPFFDELQQFGLSDAGWKSGFYQ